jgi:hypothetical protein
MSVMITSRNFGPFLRMIYLMAGSVTTFLIIYACCLLCFAGVFTAMFNNDSVLYVDFNTTVRSLYAATLNVWDIYDFSENVLVGALVLSFWELLSQVILLNILIALLSNIFGELNAVVDSEHSSVVVQFYNIWQWDKNYGSMIFLPSPFTYLTILTTPFLAMSSDPEPLNTLLSKIFYLPFAFT